MKTCKSCNEWLDQLAPNGDAVCDTCYSATVEKEQQDKKRVVFVNENGASRNSPDECYPSVAEIWIGDVVFIKASVEEKSKIMHESCGSDIYPSIRAKAMAKNNNRASTIYQAKEKQFLAMVKMGKQAFLAGRVSYMETIHNYDKYLYRLNAFERLSEQLKTSNMEIAKGWLTAFREMRGDPLLLVFCPNWAFWADDVLATDELRGRAAAFRKVHKS